MGALSPVLAVRCDIWRAHPRNSRNPRLISLCPCGYLQFRQPVRTVTLTIYVNSIHIQNAQQQISCRNGLSFIRQVTSSLELSAGAADEKMRHIIVLVLIRVAHVGAVENQGLIQQSAVTVRSRLELVCQVCHRRNVVPVQPGVGLDLGGIILMMRAPVEAHARAAVREQRSLREWITSARQVTRAQQCRDSCYV